MFNIWYFILVEIVRYLFNMFTAPFFIIPRVPTIIDIVVVLMCYIFSISISVSLYLLILLYSLTDMSADILIRKHVFLLES